MMSANLNDYQGGRYKDEMLYTVRNSLCFAECNG